MSRVTKRRLRQVTRERDEARRIAEEAADVGVEEGLFDAEEAVLPWEDHSLAVLRRGGELDEDDDG